METFQQYALTKDEHDKTLELIKQVENIQNKVIADREKTRLIYPHLDIDKDERIAVFKRLQYVLSSTILSLTFIYYDLSRKSWWNKCINKNMPFDDIRKYLTEFGMFSKMAFVQSLFSCVESALRAFLRAIDLMACHGGAAEFKSIYECLFMSKLSKCPPNGIDLLNLLRLVRNTVHNNGVYFHKNGNDITIQWRGNSYKFIQGTIIDFVTWDFIIGISDDIRNLLSLIVDDTNLKSISSEIVS